MPERDDIAGPDIGTANSQSAGQRLEGRVALMTGIASGIGRAGALLFASQGASVVAMDIDEAGGRETVSLIEAQNGRAVFHLGDVAAPADVKAAVAQAVTRFGKLDLVWANAGIGVFRDLADTSEEEWDRLIDVNLKGAFLCAKHSVPELIRAGGGTIVFTGSVNSFVADVGSTAYCASKGGLLMLCRAIALECADQGIRVNCVCPGSTDTPLQEAALRAVGADYDGLVQQEYAKVPLRRYATSEEVARAALFLSCSDSSFVTGSALMVDGGYTSR
jgi:NAD(P)-dependent dehydrogenase (short-subunit alcohol dehydrogenase family)